MRFILSSQVFEKQITDAEFEAIFEDAIMVNGTIRTLEMEGYYQATYQYIVSAMSWMNNRAFGEKAKLNNASNSDEDAKSKEKMKDLRNRVTNLKRFVFVLHLSIVFLFLCYSYLQCPVPVLHLSIVFLFLFLFLFLSYTYQ